MRTSLSSLVAAAVAEHLFNAVEVRQVGEGHAWRTVQGRIKRGSTVQQFNGFASQAVVAADEVHLYAADFAETLPAADWWVRFMDNRTGQVEVKRLAEPARTVETEGRLIGAPLKPNAEDVPA